MENTFIYDFNNSKDITDEILENSNRDVNQIKAYLNNNDYDKLIEYMIKQHEMFINLNKNVLSKIYKLKFIYLMMNNHNNQANNFYLEEVQIFNRESFSFKEFKRKDFFYINVLNGKICVDEDLILLEKNMLAKSMVIKFILFYTEKIKNHKNLMLNIDYINQVISKISEELKDELNISNILNSEEINNYDQDYYVNMILEKEVRSIFNNKGNNR